MPRLLICSRSHTPHGGADRIIADLCRELPKRGWNVTLGLTQGDRFNDVGRYVEVMGKDLPAVEIDGRQGTRSSRIRALRNVIQEQRPDIVLSMRVFDAYEAAAMEKAASELGPRLAVGVRSFEPPYLCDLGLYKQSIDLCVTSGELVAAAAISKGGIAPERVVSIGGGVSQPRHAVTCRKVGNVVRLLYAGRLDNEQKRIGDLPLFLDNLETLGIAYTIDVAGTGPAEADLQSQMDELVQRGIVRFHGWVSQEFLYETLYPNADCFVHFAAWEGMTIAPREAMANGVVPVISQFSGLRLEKQFVDGETALTFAVGDTMAAAQCVRRLTQEAGLLERLSRGASESQRGRYSFDGSMDAWAAALNRCLEQPKLHGMIPDIPERQDGRLTRLGVPADLQSRIRDALGHRVRHSSAGSEWPTSSGLMTEQARQEIEQFALSLESNAHGC
jgi:glycosyltransferase involved in cell wall biosynthesis